MKASNAFAMLPLLAVLSNPAEAAPFRKLPSGYHEGRCLYVDHGKQRIAGKCFYQIHEDGSFELDGPRQVFGGDDTVDRGSDAHTYSRDWWADVFPENGGWSGYGNGDGLIGDVHGGFPWTLHRHGACFVGDDVKVCLWRE